ncbi:MAG: zinc transporter ZntB [Gammaproteobacteria bacterium]|nr:zinc transporter ZntB [Gammaproteobacteria bacterium]MDH5650411.1 zinc transporter ZntB [Gammaproteobacteria bacterium]
MYALEGLLHAVVFNERGSGRSISASELSLPLKDNEFLWLHFDYTADEAQDWVANESGLQESDVEALLKEETRPRAVISQNGLLVCLRGVNTNAGADPEDMVALRMWLDGKRIISTRFRSHAWEADIMQQFRNGEGPDSTGAFLVVVAEMMVERIHDLVGDLEDRVAEMEESMLTYKTDAMRTQLADLRRQTINLRRYLSPQREALARMQSDKLEWLGHEDRLGLREVHDWMSRAVDDLDATRERAAIANEELANRMAEQLTQRMYMLSMIAALFMPLTFLTGLLGINVGGIPGADNKEAFLWVCYLLGGIGLLLYLLFRRRKWV